ncbi:hypothetical protein [Nonomuraea dietziae]|uniref:hypothetical protein n=1 Tax=Nonomuraea dietziae TaxID=65515 RepID=UPI0031D41F78
MIGLARTATGVALRAAPGLMAVYVLIMLVEAIAPIAVAWLTKLVVDSLTGQGSGAELSTLAVGLAGAGVLMAALPQLLQYLSSEMGRVFIAHTTAQLFSATLRFAGLRRFEDPNFHDRLRLAQNSLSTGQEIVTGSLGVVSAMITLAGMVGSLLMISPVLTGIVLATGAPALVAQLRLSRRRAAMMWDIGPAERRQMFYGDLLATVAAAKEIRLFNSGRFLRSRMMTELRTSNAARRRMDIKELSVEGLLTLLGAVVAGGGLTWAVIAAGSGVLSVGDVSLLIAAMAAVQALPQRSDLRYRRPSPGSPHVRPLRGRDLGRTRPPHRRRARATATSRTRDPADERVVPLQRGSPVDPAWPEPVHPRRRGGRRRRPEWRRQVHAGQAPVPVLRPAARKHHVGWRRHP